MQATLYRSLGGALLLFATAAAAQTSTIVVRGSVQNGTSREPVLGAVVELRRVSEFHAERTDALGTFLLRATGPASYSVSVRRLGFEPLNFELLLSGHDTSLVIRLSPLPQSLQGVRVRDNFMGVYGVLMSAALRPIPDVVVQVVGANRRASTDSTGKFAIALERSGVYVVRMVRSGYREEVFAVDIPKGRAAEVSRLLDETSRDDATGREGLWQDFDQRAVWRAMNSAIVPGSEIRRRGGLLADAMAASSQVVRRGLRIGPATCVFVNGVPKPGWPLNAFSVDEVEAVEVYGRGGDPTQSLQKSWPPSTPCDPSGRDVAAKPDVARFAVIWLRRSR